MNKIIKLIILYGIKCLFNESSFAVDWSQPWSEVKAPSLYVGTCVPVIGAALKQSDACNDWCSGSQNVLDTTCSQNKMYCLCKPGIRPGSHNIFNQIADTAVDLADKTDSAFKDLGGKIVDLGNKAGGAFKDLGNDINKGFQKFGSCMEVATLSTEYAAKYAALQTVLSGKLTDAMVTAAQETAIQPLYAARDAAKGVLETAKQFLEKVAKPIATGTISAAQQSASNFLTAGETTATGVLTAADAITKGVLGLFDIKKIHYEGSLQELAKGNLGNVSCNAIILEEKVDFNFDMNIKDPTKGIEKLANKIADKVVEIAKKVAKGMKLSAHTLHIPDDVLKLTLWHHLNHSMPLELVALHNT